VQLGGSPIVYRYIDWTITVPLQMLKFYLILSAVQPDISAGMFWRLLLSTVAMLVAGYCGEAGFMKAWAGFIVGMAGWALSSTRSSQVRPAMSLTPPTRSTPT